MLDTDQLKSFLAIVDTGSFTKAAARVNKTQSAVSMHIRRLEEQLQCELFVKQGRGVRLSTDGEKLIDYARHMLQIEASALASISRRGLVGRVRLGIVEEYAEAFIADILTRFRQHYPLVEVSAKCDGGSTLIAERTRAHELDLSILTACDDVPDAEILRDEPLVWIAGSKALNLAAPLPLALGTVTCPWRRQVERALQQNGLAYRFVLVSNSYSGVAPLVRAGHALSVLPRGLVPSDMHILGEAEGLPALVGSRTGLLHGPAPTPEAQALAEIIRATVRLDIKMRSVAA